MLSTLVIWIATYAAVMRDYSTDYASHNIWAICLTRDNFFEFTRTYISYPLWHILVNGLHKMFPTDTLSTAASVTALFNCFALWAIMYIWGKFSNTYVDFTDVSFWSVCLLFVGPLSLPVFSPYYYLGQGSGNVWHNPTNIAVKGFAVVCFFLIVHILESTKTEKELKREYVILSVLLVLSVLAKPSFFQGIVPGLGLYFVFVLVTKGWKLYIKRFLLIAMCFVPAMTIIAFQFVAAFLNGTSGGIGVGIEFGRVLHEWTPNLGISLALAFSFPLAMLIMNGKTLIRKTPIQVVLFYEFAAWLESAFLYERGPREGHGNWLWGSFVSMFIVWIVFLIYYIDIINDDSISAEKKKLNILVGMPLLFLHLLFGIGHWYSYSMFS